MALCDCGRVRARTREEVSGPGGMLGVVVGMTFDVSEVSVVARCTLCTWRGVSTCKEDAAELATAHRAALHVRGVNLRKHLTGRNLAGIRFEV